MGTVGVVAERGCVGARARVSIKAVEAPRAPSAKPGSVVEEAKVIAAFGINHGFPVRDGKVTWAAMTDTLEKMRRDALAAG